MRRCSRICVSPLRRAAGSVVVIVTVSGTTGEAGFGGTAAGPVFVRLMTAALGRLGVSRERARQLEARAKQKLRRHLETHAGELSSAAAV